MHLSKDTIQAIKITDQKAQYDEYAKWLLGRKIFLAHILEKTVDEFKGMNPKDIVPYIEGEPYISRVPVDAGLTNQIRKQSSETDHKPVSNIQKTDDPARLPRIRCSQQQCTPVSVFIQNPQTETATPKTACLIHDLRESLRITQLFVIFHVHSSQKFHIHTGCRPFLPYFTALFYKNR